MPKKTNDSPRVTFSVDPAVLKRIEAAHKRNARGKFASVSTTLRALLDAGLERDEENARQNEELSR